MDRFTVLIPAYNESEIIHKNIYTLINYLRKTKKTEYEILIAENGSTDNTLDIIKKLKKKHPRINYISLPFPSLGGALIAGIRQAKYNNVIFIPMDLSMNMNFINQSLKLLHDYDIVIGSRRVKGAKASRSMFREIMGGGFQKLVRLVMGTKIRDTTYVKAFRKNKALRIIPKLRLHYLFDTEIVIRAEREKMKIIEIPTTQKDHRPPRERMSKKTWRKFSYLSALRIFLWLEQPLITLGLLGTFFLFIGFLAGLYVVYIKYLIGLQIANVLGMLMLSVLFIIAGMLTIVLAFLVEVIVTLTRKMDNILEKARS